MGEVVRSVLTGSTMFTVNKKVVDVIYEGFWRELPIIVGNRKDMEGIQQWMVEFEGNLYSNSFYKDKTTWEDNIDKSMTKILEGCQNGNGTVR